MLVPLQRICWSSALGASACALLATAAAPAWAEGEAQRRAELRSTVRQQQSAPAAAPVPSPAPLMPVSLNAPAVMSPAAAAAYHHLSESQRSELRRQLTRELRAQGKP